MWLKLNTPLTAAQAKVALLSQGKQSFSLL
jgi:hypothetical protein